MIEERFERTLDAWSGGAHSRGDVLRAVHAPVNVRKRTVRATSADSGHNVVVPSDQEPSASAPSDDVGVPPSRRRVGRGLALGTVVAISAAVAVALHRNGHTQGDDFALYLRQARSIFDGDIADVVADNRFTVTNSASGFSPFAYPWGWPLLLSPFVKLWGFDYDRLKLLEVASFCLWMVMVHGVVRRRVGRGVALAVTAVVATAPALLAHTDQLLAEFPHAAAVGVFIWWLDRLRSSGRLIDASVRHLWILGALITLTFSFRRETIVLVGVVGMVQLVELIRDARGERSLAGVWARFPWRRVATPYVSVIATVAGFQLLLPSMLFPDNGNSRAFVDNRIGDYTGWLSRHLGLGWHPAVGAIVLVLMVVGMVIAVRGRPGLDGHLVLITLATMFASSTHFRMVDRYYFQVLPWVVYFATVAVGAVLRPLFALAMSGRGDGHDRRDPRAERPLGIARTAATVLPLLFLVSVHTAVLPGDIRDARRFDDAGRVQIGPTHPDFVPIYAAVTKYTRPTDVVAFFRARTMTLLTDRSTVQTSRIERIIASADFFAQRRNSDYVQPDVSEAEGAALGLEIVWSDKSWVLWRIPEQVRLDQWTEMAADARSGETPSAVATTGTPESGG